MTAGFSPHNIAGSANSKKKLINLLRGWPNHSLLPTQLLDKSAHRVLTNNSVAFPALEYGPDQGDARLRKHLASWLTAFFKPQDPITDDRIAISGGASQNLAVLLNVFTDPSYTRKVWFVAPAYHLSFRVIQDAGFHDKFRAIPEDKEGIDIEYFRKEMKKVEEEAISQGISQPHKPAHRPWAKVYKHVIYAVPTFSNPSSKTMSLRRRKELLQVAREYDALIITDDVYDFLQWPAKVASESETASVKQAHQPRIVDLDRYEDGGAERKGADGFGNAVSNMSFSKISSPGLRCGWCEGTPKFVSGVAEVGSTHSGGNPSQFASNILAEAMENGELQRRVYEQLQPAYGKRYRSMVKAINDLLVPLGVRLPQTDRDIVGGYFIWLTLPDGMEGGALVERAREDENVVVAQGELFEIPGDSDHPRTSFKNDIRVCFAWEEEDALIEGIERLATVIKIMQHEHNTTGSYKIRLQVEQEAKNFW
ncbi:PLP-dependent transferase [Didymella exigua CBS 183.55]|uniref:PLP-dependent transferase n=1 Tax=Didymella exigua CBS 183.55 TaxID=1150837 RepID=A0A6A5R3Q0_9PLEO|nr:PLP-dependent transferase [Didymella exigua CBS 183.55]KAF1922695.1 PLP-dependent transferase [Didymella exigua CBS 183.55]